ncbi:MAG: leucine-rich repeat protein [Bacteroidales bacterium]|nr:leucine-rich repeat protein [Bacteroidales bacterium]
MKKYIFPLLIAIFTAIQTFAYDFSAVSPSEHILYYDIISQEDKTVNVTYEKNTNEPYENPPVGDLIIPGTVEYDGETYTVIGVGKRYDRPFYNCTKLTSVTIQEGVKVIGDQAFQSCTKLKNVVLPNSLEELNYAFAECKNLQSITLSNSLTNLCEGLFWGCENLESIEIPNSVTTMGTSVFYLCYNLKSVKLPDGLTKIRESTFSSCYSLSSITFPNTLTTIGKESFQSCKSLTSIVIPASVIDIDVDAFNNCENLHTIFIESQTPPALGENAFPEDVKIYVPCDAIENYMNDEDWIPYKSNLATSSHKFSVSSSNSEYGVVTIELENACDDEFTMVLTATSTNESDYQFGSWNDGNKENPRTITVTKDTSFIATFGKKPKILNLETTNPICTSATGSASFDVTNGVAPYTVLWNDGNTDNPRSEMTTGKYYFVATDAEGYTSDTTYVTLYPNEDNMPQISLNSTDPICETENGEITATVNGGTEPYAYNWGKANEKEIPLVNFENGAPNNLSGIFEINPNNPEDYSGAELSIENSGAAGSEQAIHVQRNSNDNVMYQLNLYLLDELSLNPEAAYSYGFSFYHKGTSVEFIISVEGSGWSTEYTIPYHSDWTLVSYTWENMNIETYDIPYVKFFVWYGNSTPDYWIDELTLLSYDDAETFSSEKDVQNLAAGQYRFSVTDSYGCKTIATTSLNKDFSVVPSVELTSTNPICETENGTITATVSEGTEPYTYKWSDGATNKDRENLAEGEYTLTATDAYGCATSKTATLEKDYSVLPKFSFDIKNPICETKNGEITTTVTSGTEPYSFSWIHISPMQMSDFEKGLTNELYSNIIIFNDKGYGGTTNTDESGIANDGALGTELSIIIKASSISQNLTNDYAGFYTHIGSEISSLANFVEGISFYHKGEGIVFRAFGDNMFEKLIPAHEEWTLVTFYFDEGLAPNDFYWTYRGANNYQSEMQFQIDEINLLIQYPSDVTTKDQNELSAGTYKLKVTDSYGCTYTDKVELVKDESNKPVLTKDFKNAICGHDVGEITISYEKGNEPVEYSWNDESTDLKRENLPAGTYTFTITDAYGCTVTDETEIEYESFKYQPELALVSVSQEQSPYNLIIWQKEASEAIDFYTIYRETERLGEYAKLDDVQYNETSIYVDVTANSLEYPYRYKISATDNCGKQSELSPSHKTIHLQKNKSIGTENNLSWTAYEGFDFLTYSIFRVTNEGVEEIKKVNSSVLTYTDLQPAQGTISYYVGVELPETIDINDPFVKAESGPFNLAISNIAEVENKTAISFVEEKPVNVYAAHNAIVVENAGENQIVICNAIGQTIVRAKGNNEAVKSFNVEKGIYIVIVGNKAVKIVVE